MPGRPVTIGVIWVVGSLIAWYYTVGVDLRDEVGLSLHGSSVQGHIVSATEECDGVTDAGTQMWITFLTYQFQPLHQHPVMAECQMTGRVSNVLASFPGGHVTVRYVRGNPSISRLEGSERERAVQMLVLTLFLSVFMLHGAIIVRDASRRGVAASDLGEPNTCNRNHAGTSESGKQHIARRAMGRDERMRLQTKLYALGLTLAGVTTIGEVGYYRAHPGRAGVSLYLIGLGAAVLLVAVAGLLRRDAIGGYEHIASSDTRWRSGRTLAVAALVVLLMLAGFGMRAVLTRERTVPVSVLSKVSGSVKSVYSRQGSAFIDLYNGSDWTISSVTVELDASTEARRYRDEVRIAPQTNGMVHVESDTAFLSGWVAGSTGESFDSRELPGPWRIVGATGRPGE